MKTPVLLVVFVSSLVATAHGRQAPAEPAEVQAIAEEAFIYAFPMLENYQRFFRGGLAPEAAFNRFVHARQLATAASRGVIRPNNDTLYSISFLDLRATPLIVSLPSAPKGRYWSLQIVDLYTHNPAIFSPRNTPSTGARFLIAGPSWAGERPPDVAGFVRAETRFVLALVRIAVMGPDDLPNVTALQDQLRIAPLDAAAAPAPRLTFPVFSREKAESEGFIEYLNFMLGQLEVHPSEQATIARFARIGIGPNRAFDASVLETTTRGALRLGVQSGLQKVNAGRAAFSRARGTWATADEAFGNRERMQGKYLARASAARVGLWGLDKEEAVYLNTAIDGEGGRLDALTSAYALRFGPRELPPATAFWSLTMYGDDGFLVANGKQRFSIGDRTPGLIKDADGGLTIRISSQSPGPRDEANWLPAPPGPFSLALRLYLPDARVDSYVPPAVQRAQ